MKDSLYTPKLLTLPKAVKERESLRTHHKKMVLTNGCFDLLHPGHIYYLQKAAELGDELWVALNGEVSVRSLKGPNRPILGDAERVFALAGLSCISRIVIFNTPRLTEEILSLKPDAYAKAGDYTLETLDPGERQALESVGANIQFIPFLPGFSTTSLIEKIKRARSL